MKKDSEIESENEYSSLMEEGKSVKNVVIDLMKSLGTYSLSNFIYMGGLFGSVAMMTRIPGISSDQRRNILAASGLITTAEALVAHTPWGALFSVGIASSMSLGKKKPEELGSIFQQGLIYAVLMGLSATLVLGLSEYIYKILGQEDALTTIVGSYYLRFLPGTIPFIMLGVFEQIALAMGDLKAVIGIAALYVGIYQSMAAAFIFSSLNMGIDGVAWARSVSSYLVLGLSFLYFKKNPQYAGLNLFHNHWRETHVLSMLAKMGTPIAIQVGAELLGISGLASMAGGLGTNVLAATQACLQYLNLLVIPSITLAQSAGIFVGMNAIKNPVLAKYYGDAANWIAPIIPIVFTLLSISLSMPLLAAFMDVHSEDFSQSLHMAKTMLIITGASQFFDAIRNASSGALRGYYDFTTSTFVGVLSMCGLSLGLAYPLARYTKLEGSGLFVARAIGMITGAAVMFYRWNSKSTKNTAGAYQENQENNQKIASCWRLPCSANAPKDKILSAVSTEKSKEIECQTTP